MTRRYRTVRGPPARQRSELRARRPRWGHATAGRSSPSSSGRAGSATGSRGSRAGGSGTARPRSSSSTGPPSWRWATPPRRCSGRCRRRNAGTSSSCRSRSGYLAAAGAVMRRKIEELDDLIARAAPDTLFGEGQTRGGRRRRRRTARSPGPVGGAAARDRDAAGIAAGRAAQAARRERRSGDAHRRSRRRHRSSRNGSACCWPGSPRRKPRLASAGASRSP